MAKVRKSLTRRTLAGVSAIALGLTGVLAASGAAFAANVGPDQPGHETSGSLTITKYLGNPVGGDSLHNGTELTDLPDLDEAADVEFTIKQVGVVDDTSCLIDVTGGVKKTNAEGVVEFSNLDLGLYYVEETDAPEELNIVTPVKPFYVTIPYPSGTVDEDGDEVVEWTYDVFVYPKNATSTGPVKTVDEEQHGLQVGDDVTWTITQEVPDLSPDDIETAIIADKLDSRLKATSVVVTLADEDGTDVPLVAGDYTIDGLTDPAEGGLVTVTFTEDGLEKLNENIGGEIKVVLNTEVVSVGNGSIVNGPWDGDNGYYSNFGGDDTPGTTTPYSYWGELEVTKVDESDPALTLAGAEFSLYEAPETGCPAYEDIDDAALLVEKGVSDASGVVQWGGDTTAEPPVPAVSPLGVLIKNSNTAITPQNTVKKDFCLYETKVPAGYTVTDAGRLTEVTITAGALSEANGGEFDVTNPQTDGPDLPLTGAQGTMLLVLGGLGLVAIAFGAHVVVRNRQKQNA